MQYVEKFLYLVRNARYSNLWLSCLRNIYLNLYNGLIKWQSRKDNILQLLLSFIGEMTVKCQEVHL